MSKEEYKSRVYMTACESCLQQLSIFDFLEDVAPTQEVRRISYDDAKPFIMNIHYARRMPCIQYAFGLFVNDMLIGCVTFGQPATPSIGKGIAGIENKHNVLELNRLVILPEYNGKNYGSFLVSRALKMLPNHTFVVSYADTAWGHVGYIYQATNFLYTGATKPRTDIRSMSGGHPRHYNKGELQRVYRSSKHRYVFLCGSNHEKRKMMKELKWKVVKPYPKGDGKHYDTYNPVPLIATS